MTARFQTSRVGEFVGGKYRIVRLLAEGGMGVVYEAQHTVVKRRFAVKFLRPDLAERREILTRFHREAQAAGALESENIAAAIDFGILPDGTPYIVMEYLVGESLGALLEREGRVSVERATDLGLQACRGMEAAHASGIVHRDLKPENLFVCRREDGTDLVKVLDFGIAKLEQIEINNAATRTGTILGTPAYMSPEQARGDKTIDHRTDVYGLAAILFEMLSGAKPHPGDSHNAILHHISTQPAVCLHSLEPDLPAPLVAAVERALSSDPNQRPASVEAFGQALAPFARRQVWPLPKPAPLKDTAAIVGGVLSTQLAHGATADASPPVSVVSGSTEKGSAKGWAGRRRPALLATIVAGVIAVAAVAGRIAIGTARIPPSLTMAPSPTIAPGTMGDRTLPKEIRFFVPAPLPGAVQQIAALEKQKTFLDAAPLTAMEATPQASWFVGGTPDDVRSAVQNIIVRAAPDHRVPVLVANNIPFRDCAGYSAGGATDGAAYEAWIDGLAAGIGNARAVVILEPDGLGIIPYNTSLDGAPDWCRPTITDAQGRTIPAPGATPADRYAELNHALDRLLSTAPHASVYLDGTHAGWLGVGEIAHRLVKAGVRRAQGFFVNVSNFQPTPQSIQYATWISKCIYYANNPAEGGRRIGRYGDCTSQYAPANPTDYATWALTEKWYGDNVDRAPNPPAGPSALTHFVVDTGRNGRGPLDAARFATVPYNQPDDVIKGLKAGAWCNPPNAGVGLRPTADTGVPLADAYLWVKVPGGSDGSCDIAGGARAWDYARYNPWSMGAEGEKHFDPLWGTVDPAAGEWFAENALQLARNADPPLRKASSPDLLKRAPGDARAVGAGADPIATQSSTPLASGSEGADASAEAPSHRSFMAGVGRYAGARATGHRDNGAGPSSPPPSAAAPTVLRDRKSKSVPVTFDQQNPYN